MPKPRKKRMRPKAQKAILKDWKKIDTELKNIGVKQKKRKSLHTRVKNKHISSAELTLRLRRKVPGTT